MPALPFRLAALLLPVLLGIAFAADDAKPNVIIVFADDQGYQDLGCFGSPNIKTPHVDKLAAEGLRFTNFYSAYCVCSASRASLMTGCYQPRISMPGVLGPNSGTALHPDEITIADLLKAQGYATACVGKWHLGDSPETLPTAQGFDSYFGIPYSNDMARVKENKNRPDDLDRVWKEKDYDDYRVELFRNEEVIEKPVVQMTLTDRYTAEAVKFIKANQEQPFFLYLAHSMPHVPLFVPEDRYDPDPHKAYKLVIEHIDDSVGQIMKTLDELGIAKNTLIVYTSDNGPWLSKKHHGGSALPLRAGKATTYEGGMRVPCVMRWPAKMPAGKTCAEVAGTIDLLPTIAQVVGADLPQDRPIDGLDISPLLADPNAESPHRTAGFFYYRNNKVQAVRVGDWKLRVASKSPELYNLADDISESKNLANEKTEKVLELLEHIRKYDTDLKANVRPPWKRGRK